MSPSLNERVVYQCRLHWGIFLLPVLSSFAYFIPVSLYIWMMSGFFSKLTAPLGQSFHFPWLLLLLPGLAIGGMSFFIALIEYLKSEIVLTGDRLRITTGWILISSSEIFSSKIETISIREPLIGRMVGYGTVAVTGTGGASFRLRFLPNPQHFHGLLQTIVNSVQASRSASYRLPDPPPASVRTHDETRYMPKG